jgi:hypothetical protein
MVAVLDLRISGPPGTHKGCHYMSERPDPYPVVVRTLSLYSTICSHLASARGRDKSGPYTSTEQMKPDTVVYSIEKARLQNMQCFIIPCDTKLEVQ